MASSGQQRRNPAPHPVGGGDGETGGSQMRQSMQENYGLAEYYSGLNTLWAPPPPYPVRVVIYKGTTKGGKPIVHEIFEGRPNQVKRAMVHAGYYDWAHSGLPDFAVYSQEEGYDDPL